MVVVLALGLFVVKAQIGQQPRLLGLPPAAADASRTHTNKERSAPVKGRQYGKRCSDGNGPTTQHGTGGPTNSKVPTTASDAPALSAALLRALPLLRLTVGPVLIIQIEREAPQVLKHRRAQRRAVEDQRRGGLEPAGVCALQSQRAHAEQRAKSVTVVGCTRGAKHTARPTAQRSAQQRSNTHLSLRFPWRRSWLATLPALPQRPLHIATHIAVRGLRMNDTRSYQTRRF